MFSLWKSPKIQCLAFESGLLYFQSESPLKPLKSYQIQAEVPQDGPPLKVKIPFKVTEEIPSTPLWRNRAEQLFHNACRHLYAALVESPATADSLAQLLDPQPQAQELRRAPRAEKRLRATSHQLPGYRGTVIDLSVTGLGMLVEKAVPQGSQLEFAIDFEEQRSRPLDLRGRVCWCRPEQGTGYRIGIEFVGLSQQQSWELRQVLERLLKAEPGVISDSNFLRG
ncbi:MAG: PilZ domain-containing protein [Candidatus Eremiobacteraeota bacterium]|nr:PilZ domain-containing protein [Candidatus Eremiobacteraeota bacterium]